MNKKLAKFNDRDEINKFLEQPIQAITETMAGILELGKSDLVLATGRVIEAGFKREFLRQLGKEIKEFREKGKIKNNCFESENARISFSELLKFIDEAPDKVRFLAMKSIFLRAISKDAIEADELWSHRLMSLCKQLTSGETILLKAIYDVANNDLNSGVYHNPNDHGAEEWLKNMAKQIGHNNSELIELDEQKLIKLKLVSDRIYPTSNGVHPGNGNRLTPLGLKLCEFITKYE